LYVCHRPASDSSLAGQRSPGGPNDLDRMNSLGTGG